MADYYLVTDLGILPGGVSSTAAGINDRGHAVGTSGIAGGHNHAFLWTPTAGLQDLGVLAGSNSGCGGINQCEMVVGQSEFAGGGNNTHAFVWTQAGMQDIGCLPGDNSSTAVAVNSCGQAVGNSVLTAGGRQRGFIWTRAAGMAALGVLPGFTDTGAHGINSAGRVVGYCAAAGTPNRGFVWSPAGMLPVRSLPGGVGSDAVGINDLGEIAGSSDLGNANLPHAVLWNRMGHPRDLGLLAGGTWSTAFAVNVFKTVVGNGDCSGAQSHAFVWTAHDGMRDLNALIPANPAWALQGAVGINIFGQIVGVGTLNAQQHAFLLTPQCIP